MPHPVIFFWAVRDSLKKMGSGVLRLKLTFDFEAHFEAEMTKK